MYVFSIMKEGKIREIQKKKERKNCVLKVNSMNLKLLLEFKITK